MPEIDDRTGFLNLPLPAAMNLLSGDVARLRASLVTLDAQARDAVFALLAQGTPPGWTYSIAAGTPDAPTKVLLTRGSERLRKSITWGITGGATGNPATIVYEYSKDAGSTWAAVGIATLTWDDDGNLTAINWT